LLKTQPVDEIGSGCRCHAGTKLQQLMIWRSAFRSSSSGFAGE